jgi:hypothetical protein
LDALFVLSVSAVVVLFLLYLATTVLGQSQFGNDLAKIISEFWKKVLIGGGAGAASVALRKYVFQSRPTLNYVIWIPATTAALIIGLFVVERAIPKPPPPKSEKAAAFANVPIRFGAELPNSEAVGPSGGLPPIAVAEVSPKTKPTIDVFKPSATDSEFPYHGEIDMPTTPEINFLAELNPILGGRWDSNPVPTWKICLKADPRTAFPAPNTPQAESMLIQLKCGQHQDCPRATTGPAPIVSCPEIGRLNTDTVPVVYAAELSQPPPVAGWVVPSLGDLSQVPELAQPGYARFDVMFTPAGKAREADHYYYAVKVNNQPVYFDGFLPDRIVIPLQKGPNWISFPLENLNFTGEKDGIESLHLTVTFLKDGKVVDSPVELDRNYVALRSTDKIPPVVTDAGKPEWTGKYVTEAGNFDWTGKYIVPTNEDKYEILVGSSVCVSVTDQTCLQRALDGKKQFDAGHFTFEGKQVVAQVRPPLRTDPVAYGFALGLVLPSKQVKFTFNPTQTDLLCKWTTEYVGEGAAGKVIQKKRNRYNVATKGYGPCE